MTQSSATPADGIFSVVLVIVVGLLVSRWVVRNQAGYRDFKTERSLRIIAGFGVFTLALAFPKSGISHSIESLLTGLGLGSIIGILGMKLTRFDSLNVGKYAPNLLMGFAVTLPVVGSVVFLTIRSYLPATVIEWAGGIRTAHLLLGIMFGYFISYHAALWIKFRNLP